MTTERTWRDYLKEFEETRIWMEKLQEKREQANPHLWVKDDAFQPLRLNYDDGFASDSVNLNVKGFDGLKPVQRLVLYGTDWFEICEAVLAWASDRCLLSLETPAAGQFQAVTDEELAASLRLLSDLTKSVEEGSEDWLCYAIYFRVLELSNLYTVKAPQALTFNTTYILGGLVRQLQLSHDNKAEAISKKKMNWKLGNQNEGRSEHNTMRRQHAAAWKAHAKKMLMQIDRPDLSFAAMARLLVKNWEGGPTPAPKEKTLKNWISEIHKP